jgi:protein-disulfide isomerase
MSNEAKILTGIGVATLFIVIGAAFLFGGSSSPTKESPKLTEEQSKMLIRETNYTKGAPNAKVTLVEFGDFQCPACGAAHPTVNLLLSEYKDDVKFVYRQFPLPMHQHAKAAAYAAEAAGAQGKFFEMYDALFQNQKDWENSKDVNKIFEEYANVIGLDVEKFKQDIADKKFEEKVQKDINDGNALGVNSTPTFFLNGERINGGLPYNEFKAKIDAALGAK